MQRKHFLIVPLAATLMLASCGGDKTEGDEEMSGVDTLKTEVSTEKITETFFQVPSPGEMLTFIKMVGGKNNKNVSFLNSPDNQKNYTDAKSKAINFIMTPQMRLILKPSTKNCQYKKVRRT